jgi:class 3 adenylate cyclase
MNEDAAKSELSDWLNRHGLGKYTETLLAQDIDLATLHDLQDADFRELGFSIGHRKVLQRALAAERERKTRSAAPERRQVSILFCDLVGSTEIARNHDAEDLAAILQGYQACCHEIIRNWEGHPLGTQGDGVVACFGYPKAHENEAERAVRAALDLSRAVGELRLAEDLVLRTRVAIATGRVFVGDLVEDASAIAGDTLNLAARLQDSAEPDSVVVSAGTKRLIEDQARLEHKGSRSLRGFAEPVEVWTVSGMREAGDRGGSSGAQSPRRLIGRDRELAALQDMWAEVKAGSGRVAVISGEPGIGKSHLLEALYESIRHEDHSRHRHFCAPFFENSTLYPVIAQISRTAGISEGDDDAARLDKIESVIQHDRERTVPLKPAIPSWN